MEKIVRPILDKVGTIVNNVHETIRKLIIFNIAVLFLILDVSGIIVK